MTLFLLIEFTVSDALFYIRKGHLYESFQRIMRRIDAAEAIRLLWSQMPVNQWNPEFVDMVDQGNEVLLVVVGHSMEPFLVHERDQVLLSPITREVRKGDIILYQREDGQYILHRICRIRADGYDLVGDNLDQKGSGIRGWMM